MNYKTKTISSILISYLLLTWSKRDFEAAAQNDTSHIAHTVININWSNTQYYIDTAKKL